MGKSNTNNKSDKTGSYTEFYYHFFRNILAVTLPLLVISALILGFAIPRSSAEVSSSTDNVQLTLSTSCTVNAVVTSEHTVSLNGGQLDNNVGNTKLSAFCNDNNGYSIYAVGSSNNIDGNTDLINTVNESYNIHTGVYDNTVQTNPSSWAMKLTAGSGTGIDPVTGESVPTTPPTIINGFDNYSTIPNVYTQVAKRTSGTSMTTDTSVSGSYLNTTYQIYANSAQPAGTYNGKVKYVIVHPNSNHNTIPDLDTAFAAAGKMKVYEEGNNSYYAMQDMDSTICSLVGNSGEVTATQLVDTRDNNLYWVTKLKDGHCWMTQNLDLDIGGVDTENLTSENTDISTTASGIGIYANGYSVDDDNIWIWTPASTAITSNRTITYPNNTNNPTISPSWPIGDGEGRIAPYSAEGGDIYYYTSGNNGNDVRYTSLEACTNANHTEATCKHYSVGNYYNWTAAIASNDSTNMNSNNAQAANSICPKGWRLPLGNSDNSFREFGNLLTDEGIISNSASTSYSDNGFKNIRQSPLWFIRSGYAIYSGLTYPASVGGYWSSTANSNANAYYLLFYFGYINSADANSRATGWSIRCVAR